MTTKIFVNMPVKDLKRSISFFTQLGFSFNSQFPDESSSCMIISDTIFAMLLVEDRFRDFTKKEISDAKKSTEVILALDTESREKVDEMVSKALAAGGTVPGIAQDHGWMYQHGFEDLDGHLWEVLYMDETEMPKE